VLTIGINEYAHEALRLRFAVPDARAMGEAVAQAQRSLGAERTVQVVPVLDRDASKANVLLALQRLAGSSTGAAPPGTPAVIAALTPAGPDDTVIVYFAGHGMARGDRFHMIPADAGATSRIDTAEGLEQTLAGSITDRDLEQVLEPLDARHIALIVDACQSGQLLGQEGERFGPMNSRGLAQLAYEKGMAIIVASQAYEAALESSRLGHGYMTFALVEEGLKSKVADRAPADGQLTILEWFTHAVGRVPELQAAAMSAASTQGRELRFAPAEPGVLQTPRIFIRRDDTGPPFVIARP
jgi:uncharacterized caspase-like protein